MKISVILPCFNMEKYIESTLKSIVRQEYPNLELIIVDGGSTDNTLSILSEYKDHISLLISESDKGQYNAINKGMRLATGDILAWINADDVYFPWTFELVRNFFLDHPKQHWISGITSTMDESGIISSINRGVTVKPSSLIKKGLFRDEIFGYLQQEGMFWTRKLWDDVNGLDERYRLAADFDLWTRFANHTNLVSFGIPLACFRIRNDSRSNTLILEYRKEVNSVLTNLGRKNSWRSGFSKFGLSAKILMRKITIWKGPIYYYSFLDKKWVLKNKRTSLSSHSLTSIFSLR